MKKKFFVALMACITMINSTAFAMEKADVGLFYQGRDTKLDNPIYVEDGNYFIPLRECAVQIGAMVDYFPESMIKVRFSTGRDIEFHLDDDTIVFNGMKTEKKCQIKNVNGLSYINAKDFYELLSNFYIETDSKGKVTLQVSDNEMTSYEKNDFQNSLLLLNVAEKNQNAALSPISMKLSLAMVANGTTGQTQQQILKALGYDSLEACNDFVSNEILKWTVEERKGDYKEKVNEGSIRFANGIFYNSGDQKTEQNIFSENFQNNMKYHFGATIDTVTNDTAVPVINEWCNESTNGMIPQMIASPDFVTALINTTYFKCCWRSVFKEENNKKDIFYNIDGTESETNFMRQSSEDAVYCETENWKMLGLPYSDRNYNMYFFLPEEGNQELDNDTINRLLQFQAGQTVDVIIPKFEIESTYDFKETLQKMGMTSMFENNTDFTMYTDEAMNITDVLQKTKIIVNEQGTEASSGTVVHYRSIDMTVPPEFKANKPFYYMLTRDVNETGKKEVLFIGRYVTAKQ